MGENAKALQKAKGIQEIADGPAPAPTVDDLIADYKRKIHDRDLAIERLKQQILEQEQELARLGASQVSLLEINDGIQDLALEAEKVETIRFDLDKRGKLDDELRVIVDGILKSIKKMKEKVAHLIELEEQAAARREKAEREAAEAE